MLNQPLGQGNQNQNNPTQPTSNTTATFPSLVRQPISAAQFAGTNAYTGAGASTRAPTTGSPSMPPLGPPADLPLPTGAGSLSAGDWLLSPELGIYTLYDTNVHSSPTNALSGPAFHFHPSLLAENNSGICDTRIYGNIDSKVYPTLPYQENTFNKQAGFVQTYSPTPDLVFKAEGDYAHNTPTNVVQQSLASPINPGGGSLGCCRSGGGAANCRQT